MVMVILTTNVAALFLSFSLSSFAVMSADSNYYSVLFSVALLVSRLGH